MHASHSQAELISNRVASAVNRPPRGRSRIALAVALLVAACLLAMAGTARAVSADSTIGYTDRGGGTSTAPGGTATFTGLDTTGMDVSVTLYTDTNPFLSSQGFTQGGLTCQPDDGSGSDAHPCEVWTLGGGSGTMAVNPPCVYYDSYTFCPEPGRVAATLGDGGNSFQVGDDAVAQVNVTGGAGNDYISGTQVPGAGQTDVFDGGAGDDTLIGTAGNDTLHGGPGNDVLDGDAGNDQLFGDDGNDSIVGGAGNDTENGGAGNDSMGWAYPGNTVTIDPPPDDTTDPGADSYIGGGGDDEVSYDNEPAGVDVSLDGLANDGQPGEQDNVGTDIDHVFGSAYDDSLTGGAGPVTLEGWGGNDTLTAGTGTTTLNGGDGSDTLYGGPAADTLIGGAGDDTINADGPAGGGPDTIYGDDLAGCGYYDCSVGNDTINADDGIKQQISCGPGADVLNADALDTVAADPTQACETVNRSSRGSGGSGSGGGSGGSGGTGGTGSAMPPAVTAARLGSRHVSASKGITVQVTLAGPGTLVVIVARRTIKHVGRHHRRRVVWKVVGVGQDSAPAGASHFTIKTLQHHHRLTPGTYRLTIFTIVGKTRSRARTLTVTVTRAGAHRRH